MPRPRSYKALAATFRSPQPSENVERDLLATETVDIPSPRPAPTLGVDGDAQEAGEEGGGVADDIASVSVDAVGGTAMGAGVTAAAAVAVAAEGEWEDIAEGGGRDGSDGAGREREEETEEDQAEFGSDPHLRRGESLCRRLRVEDATPLLKPARASPMTSEVLSGQETVEVNRGARDEQENLHERDRQMFAGACGSSPQRVCAGTLSCRPV